MTAPFPEVTKAQASNADPGQAPPRPGRGTPRRTLGPFFFYLVVFCLFLFYMATGRPILFFGVDMIASVATKMTVWRTMLLNGTLPLWNGNEGFGLPLLFIMGPVFENVSLLLLSVKDWMIVWILIYLFIGMRWFYRLSRLLGIPPRGATLAAVVWTFSGYNLAHAPLLQDTSLSFLSVGVLVCYLRYIRGGRFWAWSACGGVLYAWMVTMGRLTPLAYTTGFLFAFMLYDAVWAQGDKKARSLEAAGFVAVVLGLGFLLSAFFLLPHMDKIAHSVRLIHQVENHLASQTTPLLSVLAGLAAPGLIGTLQSAGVTWASEGFDTGIVWFFSIVCTAVCRSGRGPAHPFSLVPDRHRLVYGAAEPSYGTL